MKKLLKSAILLLAIAFTLNACNQANKSKQNGKDDSMFVMEGYIEGVGTEKIYIQNWDGHRDSAQVTDGKFTLKTKLKDPCLSKLYLMKSPFFTMILAENTNYTLKGKTGYNVECIVTGGIEQEYLNTFNQQEKKLSEKYQHYEMEMKLREKGLKKEEVTEISNKINEYYKELHKLQVKFIKENPKAHYSIELIEMFASGDSKEEIMNLLAIIDPKHKKKHRL